MTPFNQETAACRCDWSVEGLEHTLLDLLASTGSGRELIARGFAADVELAAHVDVSDHVPRLDHELRRGRQERLGS